MCELSTAVCTQPAKSLDPSRVVWVLQFMDGPEPGSQSCSAEEREEWLPRQTGAWTAGAKAWSPSAPLQSKHQLHKTGENCLKKLKAIVAQCKNTKLIMWTNSTWGVSNNSTQDSEKYLWVAKAARCEPLQKNPTEWDTYPQSQTWMSRGASTLTYGKD